MADIKADRVVRIRNPHIDLWLRLASKMGQEGKHDKAVEVFNTSIRVFPNNLTNKFLLQLTLKEPIQG